MTPLLKLVVGIAGTAIIAKAAYSLVRAPLLSDLGARSAEVMAANGITDGRANWISANGWTWRVAHLSGTADAATRARTRDAVAALAGVADAVWDDEPVAEIAPAPLTPEASVDVAACQSRLDAITAESPVQFDPSTATPDTAARQTLDAIAQTLATCPGAHLAIIDHTASTTGAAINMALSQARADALVTALVERGVAPGALSAVGKGATEPLGSDSERNRRVVFRVTASQESAR